MYIYVISFIRNFVYVYVYIGLYILRGYKTRECNTVQDPSMQETVTPVIV